MKRFVGVGACYLDTILSVPHFVTEDEKLRASSIVRRRGGNCPNTLEVLQQLLETEKHVDIRLNLISVLPKRSSPAVAEVQRSLEPNVDTSTCLYRDGSHEPASCYIIRNLATDSRTIINYNDLPEMTCREFVGVVEAFKGEQTWFHFEGRIPNVTIECIKFIRQFHPGSRISVEAEKPGREGLQALVEEADVVFYAKGWAIGKGYNNAEECLQAQAKLAPNSILLCCTWGELGASALEPPMSEVCHRAAYQSKNSSVVDTIGAGDSFIAGILYSCLVHEDWSLARKLQFSNELAGRKVIQEGFTGLANLMRHYLQ